MTGRGPEADDLGVVGLQAEGLVEVPDRRGILAPVQPGPPPADVGFRVGRVEADRRLELLDGPIRLPLAEPGETPLDEGVGARRGRTHRTIDPLATFSSPAGFVHHEAAVPSDESEGSPRARPPVSIPHGGRGIPRNRRPWIDGSHSARPPAQSRGCDRRWTGIRLRPQWPWASSNRPAIRWPHWPQRSPSRR